MLTVVRAVKIAIDDNLDVLLSLDEHGHVAQYDYLDATAPSSWNDYKPVDYPTLAQLCQALAGPEGHGFVRRFGEAATCVIEQMLRGNWVDDHGHAVKMNTAMLALKDALYEATTLLTSPAPDTVSLTLTREQAEAACKVIAFDFESLSLHEKVAANGAHDLIEAALSARLGEERTT